MGNHPLVVTILTAALAGCSSYDFRQARTIDGGLDTNKLITDLKASGAESLSDGIWIPLVYCDITTFRPARPGKPVGYEFAHWTGVGPLFVTGAREETLVDRDGNVIEDEDRVWLGWGLLLDDRDERIETTVGPRLESRFRVLGLLGNDDVVYAPKK